jgi:hypothetical protein
MDKQLIKINNKNNIINEGNQIYEENNFLRDLYNMMSDSNFRIFVNKYLDKWDNIKNIILFIKLFETIEKEYYKIFKKNISKQEMLYSIKHLFSDNDLRKVILKSYDNFQKYNNNDKFLKLINSENSELKKIKNN